MATDDRIITFETYYNPMLAEIIRAKLEANGIPGFLSDESIGTVYPVYNQGAGGIKLNILEKDMERAREIVDVDTDLSNEEDTDTEK